jgi:hypothetical protein
METTRDVDVWGEGTSVTLPERSGFRGRLDGLKSLAKGKVHDVQRNVSDCRVAVRHGAQTGVAKVQSSMRTKPMLWAGLAAGTGFGLGLIGRVAHWRHQQRRAMPDIVIIEASC